MNRSRIIDTALLTVLLIGVSTFPVNLLVHDLFWYYFIEALLMLAVLIFILFYETRHPEISPPKQRFVLFNFLLLLPSVLVAFSNFFYALIMRESMVGPSQWFELYDIPHFVFIVLNVVVEEFIFRKHLLGNLTHPKKIVRILISAGIFAICHLTLFFSTFNPADLIVVAYAFGLGMVLGLVYCYTHSFIACIGLHLMFNLFNDFLFEHLFYVNNVLWYYLINVFVAVIVGIYLMLIYLVKLRKSPAELDLN